MLVPIDGSEHVNHALNFAVEIARNFSSTIVLLSVFHQVFIPIGMVAPNILPETYQEVVETQKTQHQKMLSEALKKITQTNPNLKVSTRLSRTHPTGGSGPLRCRTAESPPTGWPRCTAS